MQDNRSGAAVGYIMFASFILIMIGIFHAIDGLAAIVNNNFYVPLGDYVFKFNVTTWGWIHLIAGIIIPFEAVIVPLYYSFRALGLTNTYWSLILPQAGLQVCFGTFWMRAFFRAAPMELIEAARIDEASTWQVL